MRNTFEPYILAHVDERPCFGLRGSEQEMSVNILGQEIRIESRVTICDAAYDRALWYEQASEYMLSVNHSVSVFMARATESIFFRSIKQYKRLRDTLRIAASPSPLITVTNSLKLDGVEVRKTEDVNTVLENIVFRSNNPEAKVIVLELRRAEGRIENGDGGLIL